MQAVLFTSKPIQTWSNNIVQGESEPQQLGAGWLLVVANSSMCCGVYLFVKLGGKAPCARDV
jgi:hypothetical protein